MTERSGTTGWAITATPIALATIWAGQQSALLMGLMADVARQPGGGAGASFLRFAQHSALANAALASALTATGLEFGRLLPWPFARPRMPAEG